MDTTIISIILVIIIICILLKNNQENMRVTRPANIANPVANPVWEKCDHIGPFKNPFKNQWGISDMNTHGWDCYKKCIEDSNCNYVGVGFDCYNNCFHNLSNYVETDEQREKSLLWAAHGPRPPQP